MEIFSLRILSLLSFLFRLERAVKLPSTAIETMSSTGPQSNKGNVETVVGSLTRTSGPDEHEAAFPVPAPVARNWRFWM